MLQTASIPHGHGGDSLTFKGQKRTTTDIKQLEDSLNDEQNLPRQKQLRDAISHLKSDLEDGTAKEQQLRTEEIEAEQQLRNEQDKLTVLVTHSIHFSTGPGDLYSAAG